MLCRSRTVYKTIRYAALHTLCDITQRASNCRTVRWQSFASNLETNFTGQTNLRRHRQWCHWQISGMPCTALGMAPAKQFWLDPRKPMMQHHVFHVCKQSYSNRAAQTDNRAQTELEQSSSRARTELKLDKVNCAKLWGVLWWCTIDAMMMRW